MDPVPYEIRDEDIDEVLDAYEPVGGGDWPEDRRQEARQHVRANITDLDTTVRSAPEDTSGSTRAGDARAGSIGDRPGDRAPARRGMALGAIEDLLIRDGFIALGPDEERTFPALSRSDQQPEDA